MEILKIEHLSKIYGTGESAVKALDDISFSVQKANSSRLSARPDRENRPFYICWEASIDRQTARFSLKIRTSMHWTKRVWPSSGGDKSD